LEAYHKIRHGFVIQGKVIKIEKNKVIVAEEFEDYSGNVTKRNKEIKLPKPPGEL